tara:strand:- start:125 stop:685 length:561 start_codon:yes stop_codon:yes gene_type:complete
MADSVIQIRSEDILENLDSILENSDIFQVNSNLEILTCYIFYSENHKLLNYKKYEIHVNHNKMSRKELLSLVLKNNKHYSKTFDLTGIYKYEPVLEESKIKEFCRHPDSFDFLTSYNQIQDIPFEPGIELFNEHNCILLFFSRKEEEEAPKPQKQNQVKIAKKNNTFKKVKFNLQPTTPNKTRKSI